MLHHYLKIALRLLRRHKSFSLINVAGLAVGMACFVLIALFVQDERSYDRFHEHAERIFRITREHGGPGGGSLHFGLVGPPFAATLEADYPEIENSVRFTNRRATIRYSEQRFTEQRFYFADADVFEVFTFPLVAGDLQTALTEPFTVVLTESTAAKYFGLENPLGKVLIYDQEHSLKVTGIIQDVPTNTHFQVDFLASYATLEALWGERAASDDAWQWHTSATYVLLRDEPLAEALRAKLPSFLARHTNDNRINYQRLHLQPLTDIHLYSHLDLELETNGDIKYVAIFTAVAFLILLIACINYMNLSTARYATRALEVGIRKTLGGRRGQLIGQYVGESIVQTFMALGATLLLVELLLPAYNAFTGKALRLDYFQAQTWVGLLSMALFVGILAGGYPALFLSAFRPISLLRRTGHAGAKSAGIRKGLIVMQFAISALLIVGTATVHQQLTYINTKDLGFNKDFIVALPVEDEVQAKYDLFKEALKQHPGILSVGGSWDTPFNRFNTVMGPIRAEVNGALVAPQQNPKFLIVDHDFIPTYGLSLIAGRNFSRAYPTDDERAFVVNESTVRAIGWASPKDALGKAFQYADREGTIIGVVKDFHLESFHHAITPFALYIKKEWVGRLGIRTTPENVSAVLPFIEATWYQFIPDRPFNYIFLDDLFDSQYQAEKRLEQILGIFALLGMFIACLGIIGLTSFTAEQRSKEIGVRKVLGASVSGIVLLLSKDFVRLVGLAFVLSAPIAYVTLKRWLAGFAYHIELSLGTFVLTGALILLIAVLTVSYQSVKAALANPVETLRYE